MGLTVGSGSDLSTLFSSLNNSTSTSGGVGDLSGLLSEYNSIRNGSYAKLAKQYYSGESTSKTSITSEKFDNKLDTLNNDSTIKDNKELISDVSTFKKSLSAVKSDDTLFAKKTAEDENGNDASAYDYDKIYSKLSSFAKAYNDVIDAAANSDSTTVLRNATSMTNTVSNNKKSLEAIGFTINSDNTLSVSKDSLMKGDMNTAKTLFGATSSFVSQLETLSTNVASQAASDVYSLGGYTSTGAYKQTLETIYNTTI